MKKFESQLGHLVINSESMEDLIQNIEYDSVLLMKDIKPVIERCNPKNPYDCEVMMMLAARIAAWVISIGEDEGYNAEKHVDEWKSFFVETIHDYKSGKVKMEEFDVE